MFKSFLRHNDFRITTLPFQFALKLLLSTTTTSNPHTFAVSYFVNNFNFSPEFALKASKEARFRTSQNPDSVLTFFKNHGFPDSDLTHIIKREPWLLSSDPHKRIFPKFQFLLSKGASTSDIVRIVTGSPRFLKLSLVNRVIPTYQLLTQFILEDKMAIASIISCPSLLSSDIFAANLKLLVDNGVSNSNIFRIIRVKPSVICGDHGNLGEIVPELKNMGFNLSKIYFRDALLAKACTSQSQWNEKIDTFKSWSWSEETICEAFMRQPKCMLTSPEKINRVMQFWVNQLGWDSLYLVKAPGIFSYSLENRVIPRASVVHYLLSKGLLRETASLLTPFFQSEELFLERYVKCFKEEEASQLLKLYHGKMNVGKGVTLAQA